MSRTCRVYIYMYQPLICMSPVSLSPPVVAVCGGVGCLQVGVDASIHLSSPCSGGMLCYCYCYCYVMLCYVCMYVQTCPPEAWLLINDRTFQIYDKPVSPGACWLLGGYTIGGVGGRGTGSYTRVDSFPVYVSNYPHNQWVSFLLDVYPVISTFSGYLCVASTLVRLHYLHPSWWEVGLLRACELVWWLKHILGSYPKFWCLNQDFSWLQIRVNSS